MRTPKDYREIMLAPRQPPHAASEPGKLWRLSIHGAEATCAYVDAYGTLWKGQPVKLVAATVVEKAGVSPLWNRFVVTVARYPAGSKSKNGRPYFLSVSPIDPREDDGDRADLEGKGVALKALGDEPISTISVDVAPDEALAEMTEMVATWISSGEVVPDERHADCCLLRAMVTAILAASRHLVEGPTLEVEP